MTYLDMGCFVKLYYPETDSAKVIALIQGKLNQPNQHGRTAEEARHRDGVEPDGFLTTCVIL